MAAVKIGFDCLCLLIELQKNLADPDKHGYSARNAYVLDALNELVDIRLLQKQKEAQDRLKEAKQCKTS